MKVARVDVAELREECKALASKALYARAVLVATPVRSRTSAQNKHCDSAHFELFAAIDRLAQAAAAGVAQPQAPQEPT